MITQIAEGTAIANLLTFLGVKAAQAVNLLEIAEAWTTYMVAISGTAAAFYGVLKIITWFRNNNKNKKNE